MSAWQRAIAIALIVTAGLGAVGCEKKQAGAGSAGKELGACYGNGTCDQGLQCLSAVCVRPPPADCTPVAEKLASYRLGNYAKREDREKMVAELTTECTSAKLSIDEGKCILDATSRLDVARCPRPLLPELIGDKDGCKGIGEKVTRIMLEEMGFDDAKRKRAEAVAPELNDLFTTSCVEDLWPEEAKRCISAMKSARDFNDCEDSFPKETENAIKKRIDPVLEKLLKVLTDDGGGGSGGSVPPPPQPPATQPSSADAGSFEQACAGYLASMDRFTKCDKVPQASRDAAKSGLDQMRQAMASNALPAEAIKAMQDACAQAQTALDQSTTAMGCP